MNYALGTLVGSGAAASEGEDIVGKAAAVEADIGGHHHHHRDELPATGLQRETSGSFTLGTLDLGGSSLEVRSSWGAVVRRLIKSFPSEAFDLCAVRGHSPLRREGSYHSAQH